MKFLFLIILFSITTSWAQSDKKKNVIYKYKKYEKFDFENMSIDADASSPGDLSISPRFQKNFKNRLPQRTNFNSEMKNGIQAIR